MPGSRGARWRNGRRRLRLVEYVRPAEHVGGAALRRNFPYTHWFAQSRAVIAVAGARSSEIFPLPKNCISLWNFPPEVEMALSEEWPLWIKDEPSWAPFFEQVAKLPKTDLTEALQRLDLANASDVATVHSLKRSHEAKAVLVPTREPLNNVSATLLALSFSLGEQGRLAVPYMRLLGAPVE